MYMKPLADKEALALVGPNVYTLVTSMDKSGKPNALAVGWVTRTSIKPFLMLISIDRRRYSHEGISHHKEFVVNYPTFEQAKGAEVCGSRSGRDCDKLKEAGLEVVASQKVKVPTIKGCTVAFECKVVSFFETGDHTVFVGEVVACSGNPEKTKHLYYQSDHSMLGLAGK